MIGCRMCFMDPTGECNSCRLQKSLTDGRQFVKKYSCIGDKPDSQASSSYSGEKVGANFFAYRADPKTSGGYLTSFGEANYSAGVGLRNSVGVGRGYSETGTKYSGGKE